MKRVFSFSYTTILAAVALVAGVLAITVSTDAAPIRFDNPQGPNHFDWSVPDIGDEVILSILHGPEDQNAVIGDSGGFRQRNRDGLGTDVRRAGPFGEGPEFTFAPSGGSKLLVGLTPGDEIPSTTADGFTSSALVWEFAPQAGDPNTLLPEGEEIYLGVVFDLGAGDQFGWIGVVRTGITLDAFAWGYETEPGVPIAAGVPEPGTLSLLVLGSAALLRRRERHGGK